MAPKKKLMPILLGVGIMAAALGIFPMTGGGNQRGTPIEPTAMTVTEETRAGLSTHLQVKHDGDWHEAIVKEVNSAGAF